MSGLVTSSDEMLHDDILMTPGIIFDFDFCIGLFGGYSRLRQRRQGPLRLQIRQESRIQSFRKIFGLMMGPRGHVRFKDYGFGLFRMRL